MTWKIHHFDSVSSTMDVAKDLLVEEVSDSYVVLAKKTRAG